MEFLWVIPLVPAVGAVLNGLVGIRLFSARVAGGIAVAAMVAAGGLSALAFIRLLQLPADVRDVHQVLGDWLPPMPLATVNGPTGILAVPWGVRLDTFAAVMLLAVTGLGLIVHVRAAASMAHEPRDDAARFFCYANLFCASMLVLVLADNFLVMLAGWEGVGLGSYLLIGHGHRTHQASDTGTNAFVTNRIGDSAFVLGIVLVFFTFGTLDVRAVRDAAAAMPAETAGWGALSTVALLLVIGVFGKGAQMLLFARRSDTMAGASPVPGLLHAAAIVTVGVYLTGRSVVFFSHAPTVMTGLWMLAGSALLLSVFLVMRRTRRGPT